MDQNKALCPPWNLCNYITNVAIQEDNSELAFYALAFMARWIARGENARPPVLLSVDEGLLVSTLGTAGRACSTKLLDASWALLKRSLRQKKAPEPVSYLAKISALASLGDLQMAFRTLHEFETAYGKSAEEDEEDLFSPFTSLHPLAVACSKNGFVTLDSVCPLGPFLFKPELRNISLLSTLFQSAALLPHHFYLPPELCQNDAKYIHSNCSLWNYLNIDYEKGD